MFLCQVFNCSKNHQSRIVARRDRRAETVGWAIRLTAAWRETLLERLFVYGTLGPGRPNEHVLTEIGGSWKKASITGILRNEGWGSELGYPGIDIDENGGEVEGFLFISEFLADHWTALDKFEGTAYNRVLTKVKLEDGSLVEAHIYALRST